VNLLAIVWKYGQMEAAGIVLMACIAPCWAVASCCYVVVSADCVVARSLRALSRSSVRVCICPLRVPTFCKQRPVAPPEQRDPSIGLAALGLPEGDLTPQLHDLLAGARCRGVSGFCDVRVADAPAEKQPCDESND
jgi:hypothetical protein